MYKRSHYLFSADHVCEQWRFSAELIRVSEDPGHGFFADHARLGCSKTYDTAEGAIRGMLADHGCTNVSVSHAYDEGE